MSLFAESKFVQTSPRRAQVDSKVIMQLPLYHNGKRHLPLPSGRFVVGCTDVMIGLTAAEGCFLRLYYPSVLKDAYESSQSWANWVPHEKYFEGYTIVLGMMPFIAKRLVSWAFSDVYTPVVCDAMPAKEEQQFPVIVFSHGLTGCRTSYSAVCSELSSHGFVVAAIEHRDGSACMSYHLNKDEEKGYTEEWIPYKPMVFEKEDMSLRQTQLQHRVGECQKTLDLLHALNHGAAIENLIHSTMDLLNFKGLMDLNKPILSGHSFGSATTLRTLAVDKRFKMGVAMDAWMWPLKDELELPAQIDQPLLFINMEAFQNASNLKAMKRFTLETDHPTERRVVTLKGSVHKNQVDLPLMLSPILRRIAGAHSPIDPLVAMNLNNRLALLYLRKHLGHPVDEEHSSFVQQHKDLLLEGIA